MTESPGESDYFSLLHSDSVNSGQLYFSFTCSDLLVLGNTILLLLLLFSIHLDTFNDYFNSFLLKDTWLYVWTFVRNCRITAVPSIELVPEGWCIRIPETATFPRIVTFAGMKVPLALPRGDKGFKFMIIYSMATPNAADDVVFDYIFSMRTGHLAFVKNICLSTGLCMDTHGTSLRGKWGGRIGDRAGGGRRGKEMISFLI